MSFPSLSLLSSGITGSLAGGVNIADVFSVDLWTGDATSETITNGVDLSTEGGLVWTKNRTGTVQSHALYDTERTATKYLISDSNAGETTDANSLTVFNTTGYTLGSSAVSNGTSRTYTGWSFRKSPSFFDVVTYTGDSDAGRTVAHSLGTTVGMILIKKTNTTANWQTYHNSRGGTKSLRLNSNAAEATSITLFNDTDPTSSVFSLGTSANVNNSGDTYVAYVFAHDASASGVIQCGGYSGNSSTQSITLGWKPQYLMIKLATGGTGSWTIIDTTRGFASGSDKFLIADDTAVEDTSVDVANPISTGFDLVNNIYNTTGDDYIYMAIREE